MGRSSHTDTYGLTRYVYVGSKGGWMARYYSATGTLTKLFSDSRYGGDQEASKRAATVWLYRQSLHLAPVPTGYLRSTPHSNTGHMGVTRTTKRERNGAVFVVYQVSWHAGGRRYTKTFRLHLYDSEEAALDTACAFRAAMVVQMDRQRRRDVRRRLSAQIPPHTPAEGAV